MRAPSMPILRTDPTAGGTGSTDQASLAQQYIAGTGSPQGQAAMQQLWSQVGGNQQVFNQLINRYSSGGANYDPAAIAQINQGRAAALRGG